MSKVNIFGPVSVTGYGVVLCNIVHALSTRGWTVSLDNSQVDSLFRDGFRDEVVNSVEQALRTPIDPSSPSLQIQQGPFIKWNSDLSGPRIGLPIFELNPLPEGDLKGISSCDYVIQPSQWGVDVLKSQGIESKLVPCLGVDTQIFQQVKDTKPETCIFSTIGKLERRKGHHELIKCFDLICQEYSKMELWMAVSNHFLPHWHSRISEYIEQNVKPYNRSRIKLISFKDKQSDLLDTVISPSNFGVFPYRAEGFCLEGLEYLASGRMIIATDYSGPKAYLDRAVQVGVAEPIPVDHMEIAQDSVFFANNKTGQWAMPDQNVLATKMRQAYEWWRQNNETILDKTAKVGQEFDWNKTILVLERYLYGIQSKTTSKYEAEVDGPRSTSVGGRQDSIRH